MNRDELEAHVRAHIKIETEDSMKVFLAICSICDRDRATLVVSRLPTDAKVSTVSCNSCGEKNSTVMFHIEVPPDYEPKEYNNDKPTEK
jgi:hypothetical protein